MRLNVRLLTKFSDNVKELRIHLCQTGEASNGAREYVEKFYPELKKANPKLPILVRECSGVQPRLWARFAMGKETSIALTNISSDEIKKQMESLEKK